MTWVTAEDHVGHTALRDCPAMLLEEAVMGTFITKALDAETWPDFAALAEALEEIDRLGGGTVESYPDAVEDQKISSSFLHNATVAMFEQQGFERTHPIGKTRWVVRKVR